MRSHSTTLLAAGRSRRSPLAALLAVAPLALAGSVVGCGGDVDPRPTGSDAGWPADAGSSLDAGPSVDGYASAEDAGLSDASQADAPPSVDASTVDDSCEARFWRQAVRAGNADYAAPDELAYRSLAIVRTYVEDAQARGAGITLGGTLALFLFETRASMAWVNDRCSENSYDSSARCWENPQARLSYQLGLGGNHTSNYYPCRDTTWTGSQRRWFHELIEERGYSVSAAQLASVQDDLTSVCPGLRPEPIDYYLFAIHRDFGTPVDGAYNDLTNVGAQPFFDPEISLHLALRDRLRSVSGLSSDRDFIAAYGGVAYYRQASVQNQILEPWYTYRDAHCD